MKYGLVALGGALAFAGGAMAADTTIFLLPMMKGIVAPQAQVLWDVSNGALDDEGNVSSAKLKPADWAKLGKAAQAMKTAAQSLVDAGKVAIGPAGAKVQDEGGPGGGATAQQIQGYIDGNPKDFAEHARALADVSDAFLTASKTHDAKTLGDASSKLDEVCEACHVKYWYPDQPK